jgi:hypothetical protein
VKCTCKHPGQAQFLLYTLPTKFNLHHNGIAACALISGRWWLTNAVEVTTAAVVQLQFHGAHFFSFFMCGCLCFVIPYFGSATCLMPACTKVVYMCIQGDDRIASTRTDNGHFSDTVVLSTSEYEAKLSERKEVFTSRSTTVLATMLDRIFGLLNITSSYACMLLPELAGSD